MLKYACGCKPYSPARVQCSQAQNSVGLVLMCNWTKDEEFGPSSDTRLLTEKKNILSPNLAIHTFTWSQWSLGPQNLYSNSSNS